MYKYITKEELTKTLTRKPVQLFAGLGVLIWLTGAFLCMLPLVLWTLVIAIVFYPLWFVENKIRGED
tara:strand:+ start:118 stop:318 length:201 start_codon:yes stop_codon:yes gene_type:complete